MLTATLLLSAALAAQRGPIPEPLVRAEGIGRLAEHTWAIPSHNVPAVPNVGIVVGSRATLVIDPGMGRPNGDVVRRAAGALSRNTEFYVASTHWHVEHTTGIAAFPPPAKYLNAKAQDAEFVEGAAEQTRSFASRSPLHAELLHGAARRPADIAFEREYLLDLGGVRVRAHVVGPTHTRGDTVFFVEGDNVLFAGDVVMHDSFVAAQEVSSMKAWLGAFDLLETWGPRTIVPAHGEVGTGALIGVNRGFMLVIQARARELKAQGRRVDEVAATVQREMQAKHPTFARINGVGAAARAAYAEAP